MVITQLTTTVHASVAARSRKQRHQKEWITTNQTLLRYKRRLPYLVDFLEGRASTSIIDINNMNIKSNSQTPRRYSIECQFLALPNSRVERTDGAGRQGSDGQQRLRSVRSSASRGRSEEHTSELQ